MSQHDVFNSQCGIASVDRTQLKSLSSGGDRSGGSLAEKIRAEGLICSMILHNIHDKPLSLFTDVSKTETAMVNIYGTV